MLMEMAAYGKNVSAVCKYMGVSRKTYYQIKKAYDEGGMEALDSKSRRVPNLKNRVPDQVEQAVLKLSKENPFLGKKKVSRILRDQRIQISPNGVMAVWERHGLKSIDNRVESSGYSFDEKI